ncbi:hypothetical protein HPB49_021088 [Dermacentor silvarum]|uniref:Uncharacterized protein n=1 Tax=Dermacentor silvarum TaxID=543639 RepID=A0ACB8E372_DERSI|nr:hypothetical protein HPB49_021088 [Dermacentor silvarum]
MVDVMGNCSKEDRGDAKEGSYKLSKERHYRLPATSTRWNSANDTEKELDLCAHNSTLCGLEAGCHNVNGTFVCLCTSDLKPKRPHEPCSKAPVGR